MVNFYVIFQVLLPLETFSTGLISAEELLLFLAILHVFISAGFRGEKLVTAKLGARDL